MVFGVKHFHQYLFGREFELVTDHKPLIYIFGEKKSIPQISASRVHRWAIILSSYKFKISIDSISVEQFAKKTGQDSVLKMVIGFVKNGWPTTIDDECKTYQQKRLELTIKKGCLMWGTELWYQKSY